MMKKIQILGTGCSNRKTFYMKTKTISPCPLATNIAAISFIDRRIGRTRVVFWTGLLYTLGRMLAYVALGILLVTTALSVALNRSGRHSTS